MATMDTYAFMTYCLSYKCMKTSICMSTCSTAYFTLTMRYMPDTSKMYN